MSQIKLFILVVVLLTVSDTVMITDRNGARHQVYDRISAAVDDLFIYLKVNNNFTNTKNLEDLLSVHRFIQDEHSKNDKMFKEISRIIKTNVSNEIADKISSVNDALDEMIREYAVENDSIRNYTKMYSTGNEKGFFDLHREFEIKLKRLLSNNTRRIGSGMSSRKPQSRRTLARKETLIKSYSFIVSVHVARRFVCAGSLLHQSLALSAASCVIRSREDSSTEVQIRIGSDYATKGGSLVLIEDIQYHPEFDPSTLANNLAFLRTKIAIRFAPQKVIPIKYDKYGSAMVGGKKFVTLGWGRDSAKINVTDWPLSLVRLSVCDLDHCKKNIYRNYVSDNNFCAYFAGCCDACSQDGGGPAVAGSVLVGVLSFGASMCARRDAPTVFTSLSRYAGWIDSVLDSVKDPKRSQIINPQTFDIPTSVAFGKDEAVTMGDNEDLNPREVSKKEFGLADILKGPTEKEYNKKRFIVKSGLHPEKDWATTVGRGKTVKKTILRFSDTVTPEISVKNTMKPSTVNLESDPEEIGDNQKGHLTDYNLMEDSSKSTNMSKTKFSEMTTEAIYVYDEPGTEKVEYNQKKKQTDYNSVKNNSEETNVSNTKISAMTARMITAAIYISDNSGEKIEDNPKVKQSDYNSIEDTSESTNINSTEISEMTTKMTTEAVYVYDDEEPGIKIIEDNQKEMQTDYNSMEHNNNSESKNTNSNEISEKTTQITTEAIYIYDESDIEILEDNQKEMQTDHNSIESAKISNTEISEMTTKMTTEAVYVYDYDEKGKEKIEDNQKETQADYTAMEENSESTTISKADISEMTTKITTEAVYIYDYDEPGIEKIEDNEKETQMDYTTMKENSESTTVSPTAISEITTKMTTEAVYVYDYDEPGTQKIEDNQKDRPTDYTAVEKNSEIKTEMITEAITVYEEPKNKGDQEEKQTSTININKRASKLTTEVIGIYDYPTIETDQIETVTDSNQLEISDQQTVSDSSETSETNSKTEENTKNESGNLVDNLRSFWDTSKKILSQLKTHLSG